MLLLKVCGMRDPNNIKDLAQVKPNFIGYIFHKKSPRNVSGYHNIALPQAIHQVGVFVDKPTEFIKDKATAFNLDYVQLHGHETPKQCQEIKELSMKVIKAFNISSLFDFTVLDAYHNSCELFLFDASGEEAGGNGIVFDWDLLQYYKGETPFLLSGGINETMVKEIKKIKHPQLAGIDVNSGFEIKPAVKDIHKLKVLCDELQD